MDPFEYRELKRLTMAMLDNICKKGNDELEEVAFTINCFERAIHRELDPKEKVEIFNKLIKIIEKIK